MVDDQQRDLSRSGRARAEALLIAEQGPSQRLNQLQNDSYAQSTPSQKEDSAIFDHWIRARANRFE